MKNNLKVILAKDVESGIIKKLINEMYGIEYEKRDVDEISDAIKTGKEIYSIATMDNVAIGFCGASINEDDIVVIDYIYVVERYRNLFIAHSILKEVFKRLIQLGIKSARLQVQTYNKQRFLHYAISDKNIIKEEDIEWKGKVYKDQILLIKDLQSVVKLTLKDLIRKAHKYSELNNLDVDNQL